ncbi:hypothetical protein CC1G_15661 [Coprinopsis cinerea okayama7|uniref:G-protein coupled receptors family 1 profile domain-containing protein n=1 Tax=Coprinopsis cinerea (strain Okayama-7 / 130 / ATCC MYA-4618 / FGSC 9003) TaxID=240176 RepID=D6RQC1_COPC7|nr:hypothetical protein CC1G_15661 [Coprinopsis cinerea okayama7\|eukprot:XP_002910231.1 hypothetical protein CC1G_15661 [Coprinopsis cinerea okayama7\
MVAESNVALVRVFIILQMIGCFSFAFMIFSALVFPSVRRHPVWYNFCLSWVMFSLSYSLLSFAGQQFTLSSQTICKAQAAMVYAAPFLAGGSSIALVLQLLLNILAVLSHSPVKRSFPIISFSSIVVPWVMWTAIVIGVVVLIEQNPQLVSISHNGTFCIVIRSPVPRLTAIAAAVSSIAIVALEVVISYLLYRHRAIKDIFRQSLAMAVRVFIFTAVAMTAAV